MLLEIDNYFSLLNLILDFAVKTSVLKDHITKVNRFIVSLTLQQTPETPLICVNTALSMESETEIAASIELVNRIPVVNHILEVICLTTGMGFAAIARVTPRKWVACAVKDDIQFGLVPGGELEVESTICYEIEKHKEGVVIDHVNEDSKYVNHHTPAQYGFQSYISMPIILKDGSFFGTLCAIDPNPAKLNNPQTIGMFKLFSELIAFHLHSIEQVELARTNLEEEQKKSESREQFIAVLGHDLRNPVGAIRNSAQLLMRKPMDDRSLRLVEIINDSSFRITGLIENILDFARGHLGDGITLSYDSIESIETILFQVIAELRALWPERKLDIEYLVNETVKCDGKRIAQLLSNLLGNALTYGDPEKPVNIKVLSKDGVFTIAVSNAGTKIPQTTIDRMFQPFSRGADGKGKDGLGLGLYIASEIARAHGGTLEVASSDEMTCFTFTLACGQV